MVITASTVGSFPVSRSWRTMVRYSLVLWRTAMTRARQPTLLIAYSASLRR